MNDEEFNKFNWVKLTEIIVAVATLISAVAYFVHGPDESVKVVVQVENSNTQTTNVRGLDQIVDESLVLKPLNFRINYVFRPKGEGPLRHIRNGSVLYSGDQYKIQFTPSEDCYVYIFQIDSSGAIYRLFPMYSFKGVVVNNMNPVHANRIYSLPAKEKAFKLDKQRGIESIYFMAFRQANEILEKNYAELLQARQEQKTDLISNLQNLLSQNFEERGLEEIIPEMDYESDISWEAGETFTLSGQRLNNFCADCVSIVTFEHR